MVMMLRCDIDKLRKRKLKNVEYWKKRLKNQKWLKSKYRQMILCKRKKKLLNIKHQKHLQK
jgi:hypothetical protein